MSDCFAPPLLLLTEKVPPSQVIQHRQHNSSCQMFLLLLIDRTKLFMSMNGCDANSPSTYLLMSDE